MNVKKTLIVLFLMVVAMPAAAHVNVFGPKTFTTSSGAPQTVSETVVLSGPCDLGPNAVYTLVIASDGIASASISVNGVDVVKESDFNQQVSTIERTVTLTATNRLSATIKGGSRAGSLTISIHRHIDLTEALFAEKTFTTTGKSDQFRASFSGDPAGNFSIIVRHGATKVKSGSIRLNGDEIITEKELDGSAIVGKMVTLRAENELLVDTKSDVAGASLSVAIVRHLTDATGPAITANVSEGQVVAVSPFRVTGMVSDPSGVAAFAVNGAAVPVGAAGAISIDVALVSGPNVIRFDATDCEGNTTHREINVVYNAAPILTITSPDSNSFTKGTVAVSGTVTSLVGVQSVTANGSPMTINGAVWSGMLTFSGADGARTVVVVATDVNAKQTTQSVPVILDASAPAVRLFIPNPEATKFNIRDLPVSGSVSDAVSGVQLVACNGVPATIDAEGFFRCDLTLATGLNTIAVLARDNVGNETTITRAISYVVDTVNPTIAAVVAPPPNANGWITTRPNIAWDCQDDQGPPQCSLAADLFEDGVNLVFTGSAVDGAGNEASATITLNVDSLVPTLEVDVPQTGIITNGAAHITGTFADATSGVASVVCGGVPATLSSSSFQCTVPLSPGSQTIVVTAADRAGNMASQEVAALLDTRPPALDVLTPAEDDLWTHDSTIEIAGTVSDDDRIARVTVSGVETPLAIDEFAATVPLREGANSIIIAVTDRAGNVSSRTIHVDSVARPAVRITAPVDFDVTANSTVAVSGTISGNVTSVDVNGLSAQLGAGTFSAFGVPLAQGRTVITATAHAANGEIATGVLNVYRDSIPPRVVVYSPPAGEVVTANSIAVTGMVDDIVIGTINAGQMNVNVNGVQAEVANRAFVAKDIPLAPGQNTLTIEAIDQAGNSTTASHIVTYSASGRRIVELSGNAQSAVIGGALAQPLAVKLLDHNGSPVAGQIVRFTIMQNDGSLAAGTTTGREVNVPTGTDGQASVLFTLGHRAGAGNNRIKATSDGFNGSVEFHAKAATGAPALVVVDMGNNQFGISDEPLPRPLVAIVVDAGSNRLANVPVTFTVLEGEGSFSGQTSVVVLSDSDGRAEIKPRLGPSDGRDNNRFSVSVAGVGQIASFTATGRRAGPSAATRISGVVLDNTNLPVPGVTIRIDQTTRSATTDAQGFFAFDGAPIGYVKLFVDGTTAQRPGTWPTLEFALYTNSGQDNTIGMPIYLLPIDVTRGIQITETTGGMLTFPDLPGFALTVAPGSALFPNGSRAGTVSATLVHVDKMPMTPAFGQQPRFIVTIQPPGVHFEPPAKMTVPNLDGLAAGEITEMYSFDHDLGQFVAIGTGHVSEDGTIVESDPGVGIIKGGWHGAGNAAPTGTAATITVTASASVVPQELPPATEVDTESESVVPATVSSAGLRTLLRAESVSRRANRIRSSAITASYPAAPVGGCITLIAKGNPATGSLQYGPWEIVADPTETDPGAGTLVGGCSSGSVCRVRGTDDGVVTVRVKYRNPSTNQEAQDEVKVRFVDFRLTVAAISVDNDVPIIQDEPPALNPVLDPIWRSVNAPAINGPLIITSQDGLTSQDTLAYRVTFKLVTPLPVTLTNVGFTMDVLGGGMRGKITGRMDVPAGQNEFEAKLDTGKIVGPWKSQIIPNLLLTFNVLAPTDCPFPVAAGTAEVRAYSIGKRVTFPVYRSTLEIATAGTAVLFRDTSQLISKVWNRFGGGGGPSMNGTLKAWDSNPVFTYYPNGTMFGASMPDEARMLANASGAAKCGALGLFMGHALALNGLLAYDVVVAPATPTGAYPRTYTHGMLVKKWSLFDADASYPGLPVSNQYPDADKYKWWFKTSAGDWEMAKSPDVNPGPYGDITSDRGVNGQNSDTPSQKAHVNHAILKVENRFLDPSYGLEYTDASDFETKALDGYFTVDVPPAAAPAKMLARKKGHGVLFWISGVPY